MGKQKPSDEKKEVKKEVKPEAKPEKPEIKEEEKLKPDLEKIKKINTEHSEVKAETETVKTRKKRRTKKEMEADAFNEKTQRAKDFSESITGVGSMILAIAVERMPQPKPLTPMEKNMFDNAFNKLAYKYAEWLGDYSEETAFVLVASMIIIPRARKPKPELKEAEEKKSE